FYRDRPLARIAARKKFLVSRIAEVCMLAASALLYHRWHTLDLDALARLAGSCKFVPVSVDLAAALIALAVLLKSAQLPVHGWLLEVMEAPTSVSALLHAGIVNLGGYVLIRLAPLITTSPPAQAILVIVGSTTAVLAGLTTMTCPSIKTRLAWSTCSQMGLMAAECGLGLYALALLHLLAHALYKAHAFLSSGEAVRESQARRMPPSRAGREARHREAPAADRAPLMLLVVVGSEDLWYHVLRVPTISGVAAVICAFGIATLLWESDSNAALYLRNLGAAVLAVQLYLGWHAAILSGLGVASVRPLQPLAEWTGLCFLLLYLAQWGAGHRANSASIRRLFTWAAAGYFLDEPLTRLVTRRPPRHGARAVHPRTTHRLARQEGEAA
ncbi:NADH dehydrogenase subunit L, partial [mine drainage metagenome]